MACACIRDGHDQDGSLPLHSKLELGQPEDETRMGKVMWLCKRILKGRLFQVKRSPRSGRELPDKDRADLY